jgi:hypothetical protein
MNDDELKALLRGADRPVAVDGAALATRARRIERRRVVRSRLLLAAAPVVLLMVVWGVRPREAAVAPAVDRAELPAEIERLRAEAAWQTEKARRLVALAEAERLPRATDALASGGADPLADVREQVDVVAYQMVLRADGLHAAMMDSAEAVELYREVLRLFPTTYSAEVARERLAGLGANAEKT